jgi:catechol 2,3-dioxygenase-like lactoylglutathione lyase family enzyme
MMGNMSIDRVQLFSIPVSDQDKALDFYISVLGFELVSDAVLSPGRRWIMVRPRGAQTAITLVTWFPSMEPGSVRGIVIETDDLEAMIAELNERALTTSPIEDAPWGRFVQFADPDGNGFVLQQSSGRT